MAEEKTYKRLQARYKAEDQIAFADYVCVFTSKTEWVEPKKWLTCEEFEDLSCARASVPPETIGRLTLIGYARHVSATDVHYGWQPLYRCECGSICTRPNFRQSTNGRVKDTERCACPRCTNAHARARLNVAKQGLDAIEKEVQQLREEVAQLRQLIEEIKNER